MFDPIKHREQFLIRLVVGGLRCREPGAINAVVDCRIDLRVQRIDVGSQLGRPK
jgi:hypothetical protein